MDDTHRERILGMIEEVESDTLDAINNEIRSLEIIKDDIQNRFRILLRNVEKVIATDE